MHVLDTPPEPAVDPTVGHRRRLLATGLLAGVAAAVVGAALVETTRSGLDRPVVAVALALALLGSNLTPVVAIRGGRISAFTPVGALLVPIGLLLSAPAAILVYAAGEVVGVPLSHRLEGRVAAPDRERSVRTAYTLGKSILGGTVGILSMQAAAGAIAGVPGAVVAAVVGIALSSGFDHVTLAFTAVWVRGAKLGTELTRDLNDLALISGAEIVAGALIAVLAGRDVWSLILGLGSLGLLLVAATNYAHAVTERAGTRELLGLAHDLGQATRVDEVLDLLVSAVRRLLPEDQVDLVGVAPDADLRAWPLSTREDERWLVIPRIIETRDYQEQPTEVVDAAVSLAQVALARAADQQRIVAQDQLRSLVLSTVAHDLRSPLTSAVGALQTLIQFDADLPEEQKIPLLEMASRSVNRVSRLVSDILGLEIAQQRPITRGPVDVATTVQDSVNALSLDATRTIEVRVDPATAAIDAVSLGRIVENLVLNACKYSPSGGAVTVTGVTTSDGGVELVVADEGPGVPAHQRTTIFDAFEQAGRGHDGVGLGLFLARRFTELHDGRIWVDDAPTGGAAFHVWLPAGDRAAPATPAVAGRR